MKFTRTTVTGIDTPIQGHQDWLYPKLVTAWGLDGASAKDYNSYGRAYRNERENGFVPEVFMGGRDYQEVLLNDKVKALSFYSVDGVVPFRNNQFVAQVALIFFADLKRLAPGADRNDEELRQDVIKLVQGNLNYGFKFTGYEVGVENVLKDYAGVFRDERMKFRDMQPFHSFCLNFELTYKQNCI